MDSPPDNESLHGPDPKQQGSRIRRGTGFQHNKHPDRSQFIGSSRSENSPKEVQEVTVALGGWESATVPHPLVINNINNTHKNFMNKVFDIQEVVNNLDFSLSNEALINGETTVYSSKSSHDNEFEDDGALNVVRMGVRFCHYVGDQYTEKQLESYLKKFAKVVDKAIAKQ